MNTLPAVFPTPEKISYEISSDYRTDIIHFLSTPYNSIERVLKTISTLKISVPFKDIITRDMGFSVCPYCKAKYVGHQFKCSQIMQWYSEYIDSFSSCNKRGNVFIGQRVKETSYNIEIVRKTEMKRCDTETVWDLQEEFNKQQAFFSFVSLLENLPAEKNDLIAQFSNCLPQGVEDKHRITLLENQIANQRFDIERLMSGMNQIAQKMQNAGQALSW